MNRTNHCASADNRPPSPSPLHGRALRARRCSKQLTKSKFSSLGRRGHPGRPEQIVGARCKVHRKPPGCKTGWGARAATGSPPAGARGGLLQMEFGEGIWGLHDRAGSVHPKNQPGRADGGDALSEGAGGSIKVSAATLPAELLPSQPRR